MPAKYVALTSDWTYVNFIGEKITFKKGHRFRLDEAKYLDSEGDLVLRHWHCYGCSEIVEKKYFEKKN